MMDDGGQPGRGAHRACPPAIFSQSSIANRQSSMEWVVSLVGRRVNVRDGHKLAENMDAAGLLLEIINLRGGVIRQRFGAAERTVFELIQTK